MTKAKAEVCARCGASPAPETFTICANHHDPVHVCTFCDVAVNLMFLRFVDDPKAGDKIMAYIEEKMNG